MLTRLLLLAGIAACAAKPSHPIHVAMLVDGEPVALAPTAVPELDIQPLALPKAAVPPADTSAPIIASARKAYGRGDWATCLSEIRRVDLVNLLASEHRDLAARALTFEIACHFEGSKADAQASATRFASLGLDVPGDFLPIEVEQLITTTITRTETKLHPLAIAGELGARLSVDGRAAACTLPCTIDLPAGDHVLAVTADGFAPASRMVRVPGEPRAALAQQPASVEVAGQQLRARLARGLPATDATSVSLLARLAGQPNVAIVHADKRLHGALIVDGVLRAHADRDRDDAPSLMRELAYDAHVLQRPRVWQRPWFWIAVTGATLAVSGAVVYFTYTPDTRTKVGFFP